MNVNEALVIKEQLRLEAIKNADEKRNELHARLPRIKQIDKIIESIPLRLIGGYDPDELKKEAESLNEERERLLSACGYEPDYDEPRFECKLCNDSGYGNDLKICACVKNLLSESSKGRYGKDTAITFRNAAKNSIGSHMPAKSLELKHTIKLIRELDAEIEEIENEIKIIMDEINSPILTIPGINYRMGAMIIAKIGDFNQFDSPDKILAFAVMSPSTYQSGQLDNSHSRMEKRGSKYFRYALFNATTYVCL